MVAKHTQTIVSGVGNRLRRQMQKLKIEERRCWKRRGHLFGASQGPGNGGKIIFTCSIWRVSKWHFGAKRLKTAYFHAIAGA